MNIAIPTSLTATTAEGRKRELFGFLARWTSKLMAGELSEAEVRACSEATWNLSRRNSEEHAK